MEGMAVAAAGAIITSAASADWFNCAYMPVTLTPANNTTGICSLTTDERTSVRCANVKYVD
jgi:hypothetical protein